MADNLEPGLEIDTPKPAKEIPVVQDHGVFKHATGDIYEGFFEAKKKDRSVKMQGSGIYTTAEGDIYSGEWDADRLGFNEDVIIKFIDGSKYAGRFKDWSYNGHGKYFYPDSSVMECDFIDNTPIGNLTLIDPNAHMWLGKAEQGYGWVEPVNHFYNCLEKTRESKVKKQRRGAAEAGVRPTVSNIKSVDKD